MYKKLLTCLLALSLVLSFAACGQPANIRGEVTPNSTTEATTAPAVTEPQFSIGSATGNTYKNTFIGIQCTLDSNWVFKTDEEMKAVNESVVGVIGDQYEAALANATVVQDMMATHANQMDTVNVVLEKLGAASLLITEEQYLNLSKESTVNALTAMGMTIASAEISTVKLAGQDHACLNIVGSYSGIPLYEKLVVIKCGGYIACITTCTWLEDTCQSILDQFQPC